MRVLVEVHPVAETVIDSVSDSKLSAVLLLKLMLGPAGASTRSCPVDVVMLAVSKLRAVFDKRMRSVVPKYQENTSVV